MIRLKLFIFSMAFGIVVYSQSFVLPEHFIIAKQGFAVSLESQKDLFLNLELEYYPNNTWSLVSGANLMLTSEKEQYSTRYTTEVFLGTNYHVFIKSFDLYGGFQPGYQLITPVQNKKHTDLFPLITCAVGVNYYSTKYFHFFTQLRYVRSNQRDIDLSPTNQLRLSFGLGYNLNQIYNTLFRKKESL